MGLKYSINSAGRIVAERDIYSLGGFIPKGRLGGSIKDGTQLSQEGECWLSGGDISTRPDVRLKDNAYIGDFFTNENTVHTDGIMEFSGDTFIPGYITVRCPQADPKNNVFIKDSFIGVSMDVLCGPESTTTAFPFGQGIYNSDAAKGTLFENMVVTPIPVNICRSLANLRLGKDTYLYIPTGYNCRVLWAYYDTSNRLAYSGESTAFAAGLHKLSHPVYKIARMHIAKVNGTAMTPADLLGTGAKILGHISGNLLQDLRPESVSGEYAMVNSSFIAETDNFGLYTTQLRFLAGSMYDTTMYTKTDRQDYKPYGTFRNVERLEYTKYLGDSYRTAATRDTYISAYDCPLLRVDNTTYNDALAAKGNLVLRRCIVPKAIFTDNIHNGNVYEDIDFSYASDHLGAKAGNNFDMWSSHKQGEYAAIGAGTAIAGLISRPENLAAGSVLGAGIDFLPLDGSIVEQGAYEAGNNLGVPYEETKVTSAAIVRSYKPVSTASLSLPTMPSGYVLDAIVYLDESFIIRRAVANPASIENTYQYAVMQFRRADASRLNVSDFIALGLSLRYYNYSNVPEITGSAYVGAGCTVRRDVQLIGDPYVNRVFDVNVWERGTMGGDLMGKDYESGKAGTGAGNRFRFVDSFPVEPGDIISCAEGYSMYAYWYDGFGVYSSQSNWSRTFTVTGNKRFLGIVLKKATAASDAGGLITEEDLAIANVKYVRAFKKRRYIVNELDRTSPEDILLDEDMWERGYLDRIDGKTYEELKSSSSIFVRLKRPINTGRGAESSFGAGHDRKDVSFDAVTKCVSADNTIVDGTPLYGTVVYKVPSAAISVSDVANSRFKVEFVPSPRIIVPYGQSTLSISGPKIQMYDNAVLSRNISHDADIVLQGDAVMGYNFSSGGCLCSNGHDDAIIKRP